jgi:alkanesulfonate monooxygenase SsuD/methylene tetrahydromethanopterin reductase-like flavin-dependent oxidoreductase (luciferase family)
MTSSESPGLVRFALYTEREHLSWSSLLPMWQEADDIPLFESAWTFDHLHLYPVEFSPADVETTSTKPGRSLRQALRSRIARREPSTPLGPCLEGWTTLAALLQATRRIRGGCLVTSMAYRHPAVLAKMAATVDIISGGRLELGLGTGWSQEECDAYGISLGNWSERFDRFDEGIECILSLLSEASTTFEGKYFHLFDAMCEPKPVQRPHPPILIGGAGERRTIPTVARWAQHWQAGFDLGVLPRKLDHLRQACFVIGRDPSEITVSMLAHWNGHSGARFVDHLTRMRDLGVDMAIISVEQNSPRLLARLADRLGPLAA